MDLAGVIAGWHVVPAPAGSPLVLLIYRSPSAVSTPPGNSVSISSN
jgi:hypothetical protein